MVKKANKIEEGEDRDREREREGGENKLMTTNCQINTDDVSREQHESKKLRKQDLKYSCLSVERN